jgi:hypothetical protein
MKRAEVSIKNVMFVIDKYTVKVYDVNIRMKNSGKIMQTGGTSYADDMCSKMPARHNGILPCQDASGRVG